MNISSKCFRCKKNIDSFNPCFSEGFFDDNALWTNEHIYCIDCIIKGKR